MSNPEIMSFGSISEDKVLERFSMFLFNYSPEKFLETLISLEFILQDHLMRILIDQLEIIELREKDQVENPTWSEVEPQENEALFFLDDFISNSIVESQMDESKDLIVNPADSNISEFNSRAYFFIAENILSRALRMVLIFLSGSNNDTESNMMKNLNIEQITALSQLLYLHSHLYLLNKESMKTISNVKSGDITPISHQTCCQDSSEKKDLKSANNSNSYSLRTFTRFTCVEKSENKVIYSYCCMDCLESKYKLLKGNEQLL
jgi:hypothetical protein